MAIATNTTAGEIVLGGDLTGTATYPELVSTGVIPGIYAPVQRLTVDSKGRAVSVGETTPEELAALIDDATVASAGVIQVGSGLSVSSGTISFTPANATTSSKGVVQIGTGLDVADGTISVSDGTTSSKGFVQVGSGLSVASGVVSLNMPDASTSSKGFMQAGAGLSVSSGTLSLAPLADATTSTKGVIQVGSGLTVSGGSVSLTAVSDASTSSKGFVQIGSGLSVTAGTVSLNTPDASTSSKGFVQVGSGLNVSAGTLSLGTVPDATTSTKGFMQAGSGVSISAGTISVSPLPDATTSSKGVIKTSGISGFDLASGVLSASLASSSNFGVVKIGTGLRTHSSGALMLDETNFVNTGVAGTNSYSNTWVSGSTGLAFAPFEKAIGTTGRVATVSTGSGTSITLQSDQKMSYTTNDFSAVQAVSGQVPTGKVIFDGSNYFHVIGVGAPIKVYKSPDGYNWSVCYTSALSESVDPSCIEYNSSRIFVLTKSGSVIYSFDHGVTWGYNQAAIAADEWRGLNGLVSISPTTGRSAKLTIAAGGSVSTSGAVSTALGGAGSIHDNANNFSVGNFFAWNNSVRWVIVGQPSSGTSTTAYSSDGLTWTAGGSYTASTYCVPKGVVWDGTNFVIPYFYSAGSTWASARSTNGASWTAGTMPSTTYVADVRHAVLSLAVSGSNIFVIQFNHSTSNFQMFSSINSGTSWTAGGIVLNAPTDSTVLDKLFINVANNILFLEDGSYNLFFTDTTVSSILSSTTVTLPITCDIPNSVNGTVYELVVRAARPVSLTFTNTGNTVRLSSNALRTIAAGAGTKFTLIGVDPAGGTATNWFVTTEAL
jgi:hypothetical protein